MKNGAPAWKSEYLPGTLRSYKGTAGGLAIQVAASKDSETAADTSSLSGAQRHYFDASPKGMLRHIA